jgi:integrase
MPRAIRLEVKHVRYVNGKPQVRVRIPDELQKFFPNEKGKPKQALTRFLRNTDVRGMKDEVAVIVGEIKAQFADLRNDPVAAIRLARPDLRRLEEIADFAAELNPDAPIFGYDPKIRYPALDPNLSWDQQKHRFGQPPGGNGVTFGSVIERWAIGKSDTEARNTRTEAKRFAAFIGHDDMSRVSRKDAIQYKDHLIDQVQDDEISSKTALNQLKRLKAIFAYAVNNDKEDHFPADPMAGVKLGIAVESEARPDFTLKEMQRALLASRQQEDLMVRWFQWLGVFAGLRDSEIMRAHKDSIQMVEGVWCFCVLKKYKLKTKNSERTIPLHSALVAEGFLNYVAVLPEGSKLFPDYTEDNIFAPLRTFYEALSIEKRYYSLRHTIHTHFRFRTDIDGDVKRYLTGHGKKDAHAEYGSYPGDKLVPAIETIPNPLTQAR